MKSSKSLCLLLGFLIFLTFLNYGNAWNNGNSGSAYAYTYINYDYEDNYGTHDWIADAALNALLNLNESKWNWLELRKEIYFVGTEAPDNSGVNMTLNGEIIEGFGDTTYHHIYFFENGTISHNEDDSAIRAKLCGDLADSCIEEEKLDQAAFYLGAMTHYIADVSMYAHVAENNVPPHNVDFDEHHSTIEGYVQTRTNEYDNMEEFFKIFSVNIDNKKPYDVAIDLAWDTYYDPNPSESTIRNALWLHNNFFSWTGKLTYAQRIADSNITHQLYYDRIEQNLNNAIESCASAMNNITLDISSEDNGFSTNYNIPSYSIIYILFIGIATIILIILNIKKKIKRKYV